MVLESDLPYPNPTLTPGDDGTGWGYGTVDDGNGDDAESSSADDHDDDAYECSWKCIMCCFKALGFGYDAKVR